MKNLLTEKMSIKLGEQDMFRFAVESTPLDEIELVVLSLASKYLARFLVKKNKLINFDINIHKTLFIYF